MVRMMMKSTKVVNQLYETKRDQKPPCKKEKLTLQSSSDDTSVNSRQWVTTGT